MFGEVYLVNNVSVIDAVKNSALHGVVDNALQNSIMYFVFDCITDTLGQKTVIFYELHGKT